MFMHISLYYRTMLLISGFEPEQKRKKEKFIAESKHFLKFLLPITCLGSFVFPLKYMATQAFA